MPPPLPPKPQPERTWHRVAGVATSLFLILIVVTGIGLQHPAALGLGERFVTAGWLLDWYGIEPPAEFEAFRAGGHLVAAVNGRARIGTVTLPIDRVTGAAAFAGSIAVATPTTVVLVDPHAGVIARLPAPAAVTALTVVGETLFIATGDGHYATNATFLEWTPASVPPARWPAPAVLTQEERETLTQRFAAGLISFERLLRDVHSGRILGPAGPYLVDLVALGTLLLAITGIVLYLQGRRQGRRAAQTKPGPPTT